MNKINKLLDKLKSDINDTKDIDNNCFVEQALSTLDELKKQLTLTDVVFSEAELKNDINFERKSSARVFNNEKGIWEFI
tara:strand:+ start:250 stop:486 length:237 start_codon:yes stop_codon:yes gene_type:complete